MKRSLSLILILATLLILPSKVFALKDSDIKTNGEITIKSVPITSLDAFYQVNELLYADGEYSLTDCNSDYTVCSVYKGPDDTNIIATNVSIKYEYDSDIKELVDGILKKIPEGGKTFYIEDIYTIKWIIDETKQLDLDPSSEGINPIMYSPEFNSFIGYNNFYFEPRQGDDTMYAHVQEGTSQFNYQGTIYGYGHFTTRVNSVIYVNDDETDIEGAIKTRLSKYFNVTKVEKDDTTTIDDLVNDALDDFRYQYNECATYTSIANQIATLEQVSLDNRDDAWYTDYNNLSNQLNNLHYYGPTNLTEQYASADEYATAQIPLLTDPDDVNALWNFKNKVLPNVYVIYLDDELISSGIPVFVIKDSKKVVSNDLEVKSRDTKTGVTINNIGTSKSLPFDTIVKVSKLTGGTDYEKIIKVLETLTNTENIEMFDLKLFANSINNYISKLDDGSFEVKIPLSDKFKNADKLVVYYVGDNDKVEEHEVKSETIDGKKYAVFNTNHFSIYTLSATISEEKEETSAEETTKEVKINNPATGDNILIYIGVLVISSISLIVLRKNKTN